VRLSILQGIATTQFAFILKKRGFICRGYTLIIHSPGNTYESGFIKALEYICRKNVKTIYFGHGSPLTQKCNEVLQETLRNVRKSQTA
jgi:hypothetical protein